MLRTGPTMLVIVLWQIQSVVSQSAMMESVPPVARYRPVGCSSAVTQDDVCPANMNSSDLSASTG